LHERVHPWRRAHLLELRRILGGGALSYGKRHILGRRCTCLRRLQGLEKGTLHRGTVIVREGHTQGKGALVLELGQKEGAPKRGGRTCPRASPNITKFLQGMGASTSGQRQSTKERG
jgi:hypothetical protein